MHLSNKCIPLRADGPGTLLRIEHRLGASLTIAKIDEEDAAEIAAGVNPADEGDGLPGVLRPEFIAMLRAVHDDKNEMSQCGFVGGFAKRKF